MSPEAALGRQKKKCDKWKVQKKQRVSKLKSAHDADEDEPTEETMGANAGAQFSSHSNQKKHQS